MSWLIGSWKGIASNTPFYEAWRKTDAHHLTQYGIKITENDTTISIIGKITIQDDKATYGDQQYQWSLSELTATQMIFSNSQLRFPTTITWRKMPNGHWYCLLNNATQKIEYDIQRVPGLDAVVDKWIETNKKT